MKFRFVPDCDWECFESKVVQYIESPNNPRLKTALRLRSPRGRQQQQRIVIDGIRETIRSLQSELEITELFFCEELIEAERLASILNAAKHLDQRNILALPKQLFKKISFGDRTDGVVAIANRPETGLDQLKVVDAPMIAVLESFEKPGNLGAVLRSADGAGIDLVLIASPKTDLFHPNSIRNSVGCVFHLPIAVDTTERCQAWLKKLSVKCYAAIPDSPNSYFDANFCGSAAIVLGNEAQGLSAAWTTQEVTGVKLPMCGNADSLNVSAAATAMFYEAFRQRHLSKNIAH